MKNGIYSLFLLLGLSVLLSSCEKDGTGGGKSSKLEGDYVCQKIEILFTNGETRTITKKEDYIRTGEFLSLQDQDYIMFDYEYLFSNGRFQFKENYTCEFDNGGKFSIEDNYLNLSFLGIEIEAYKIITNSGKTLVLEAMDDQISLVNLRNSYYDSYLEVKKSTATYKRQ